jgi:hypothetical protein
VITDGPYVELKEMIGVYVIANVNSIDEALSLAEALPPAAIRGNAEERDILKLN